MKKDITLCLFINSIYNNFSKNIWKSILSATKEKNINLVTFNYLNLNYSDNLYSKYNIFHYLDKHEINGFIVSTPDISISPKSSDQFIFFEYFKKKPTVIINSYLKDFPSIVIDNETGINTVLEHFIIEHNKKKIVYISGDKSNYDAEIRLKTFQNGVKKYNIEINNDYIYEGDFSYNSGITAVKEFLDKRKIQFDAILAANDNMAIGAIRELQKRKIKIPDEISVIGFDNINHSLLISPELSTVSYSKHLLAEQAVSNIISLINGEKVENLFKIPVQFNKRKSCGCEIEYYSNKYSKTNNENIILNEIQSLINMEINFYFKEILSSHERIIISKYLILSLNQALKTKKIKLFIYVINIICKKIKKNYINITMLRYVINNLFNIYMNIKELNDKKSLLKEIKLKVENFILSKTLNNRKFNSEKYFSLDWRNYIISNLFTKVYSFGGLKKIIETKFNKLGIHAFYLFYNCTEDQDDFFDISLMFEKNKFHHFKNKDLFSKNILFFNIHLDSNNETFLIFNLYNNKKPVGIVIYKTYKLNINDCYKITLGLSDAIQRLQLFNKIKKYKIELSEEKKTRMILAEDLKQKMTQFLLSITHNTKNSLTIINNNLKKYLNNYGDNNKEINTIHKYINKLITDMENHLNNNIFTEEITVQNEDNIINFSEILKNKIFIFKDFAKKKSIKLKYHIEEDIFIKADASTIYKLINDFIGKIINNIVENGVIEVTLTSSIDNNFIFKISSADIFLSQYNSSSVFFPFNQQDNEKNNFQGIDIELYTAKKIIDKLNGDFNIVSIPNKGCSVIISLQKYTDFHQDINSNIKILDSDRDKYKKNKLINTDFQKDKKTILLIENDRDMLLYLYDELKDIYNIIFAEDTNEALDKIKKHNNIFLIVCDIVITELKENIFFQFFSKNKELLQLPFIFLITKISEVEKIKKLDNEVIDYLLKPFNIESLKFKIKSIKTIKQNLQKKIIENTIHLLKNSIIDHSQENNFKLKDFDYMINKYKITKREKEIISFLSSGLEYKEIAYKMNISYKTVDRHFQNVYKKTGTKNKVELINLFYR